MGQWLSCRNSTCTLSSTPPHDPMSRTKWELREEQIYAQYHHLGKEKKEKEPEGQFRILLMGLSGAGKTSLLHTLQLRSMLASLTPSSSSSSTSTLYSEYSSYIPSPAITRTTERYTLTLPTGQHAIVYDTSGECEKRQYVMKMIETGCYQISRLVFVVDSSDPSSFPLASHYLRSICSLPAARLLPLLIIFTKQDVTGAADRATCIRAFHLDTLHHPSYHIIMFAATHTALTTPISAWSKEMTTPTKTSLKQPQQGHHYDIVLSHLHDSTPQPLPIPLKMSSTDVAPTPLSTTIVATETDIRTRTQTLTAPTTTDMLPSRTSFSHSINAWRMAAVSIQS